MRFSRHGRHSPPRVIPVWSSTAASALLTVGVLVALVGLHGWSEHKQAAFQSVSTLHTVVALEEEGVLDSAAPRAKLEAEARVALAGVESSQVSASAQAVIVRLTNEYQTVISMELAALRDRDPQLAATLDRELGDKRFTALDTELAAVGRQEASSASNGVPMMRNPAASIARASLSGV